MNHEHEKVIYTPYREANFNYIAEFCTILDVEYNDEELERTKRPALVFDPCSNIPISLEIIAPEHATRVTSVKFSEIFLTWFNAQFVDDQDNGDGVQGDQRTEIEKIKEMPGSVDTNIRVKIDFDGMSCYLHDPARPGVVATFDAQQTSCKIYIKSGDVKNVNSGDVVYVSDLYGNVVLLDKIECRGPFAFPQGADYIGDPKPEGVITLKMLEDDIRKCETILKEQRANMVTWQRGDLVERDDLVLVFAMYTDDTKQRFVGAHPVTREYNTYNVEGFSKVRDDMTGLVDDVQEIITRLTHRVDTLERQNKHMQNRLNDLEKV